MGEDDNQNLQKGIEKDLFDEHNKILDRFYSLISLTFTAFGFSLTVLTFTIGKGIESLQKALGDYHIKLCFLSLFLAFLISIFNVLSLTHHKRLVTKNGSIGYREGDELLNNNVKIYNAVSKQKDYYINAIIFIAFALIALFNSFLKHYFLSIMLTIGFLAMVVLSIRESRK